MWQEIVDFGKRLFQRVTDDDIFGIGAQLAYFLLLSLFPFLLFLMTLVGIYRLIRRISPVLSNNMHPVKYPS